MNTIKLIHKLSELGELVEHYSTDWYIAKAGRPSEYFKDEVRKVAGEILQIENLLKPTLFIDYSSHSFDDLFARFLGQAARGIRHDLLTAICHKLGVELEASDE